MQTDFRKYPSPAYGDVQKEETEWQLKEKSLTQEKWKRLFPDGITVFSGFDGMGVTRIALHNMGIPVKKYMASEIDNYAITLSSFNFVVQHMGDITKIKPEDVGEVDLMVFGSPCQGFSNSGKKQGSKSGFKARFFIISPIVLRRAIAFAIASLLALILSR